MPCMGIAERDAYFWCRRKRLHIRELARLRDGRDRQCLWQYDYLRLARTGISGEPMPPRIGGWLSDS